MPDHAPRLTVEAVGVLLEMLDLREPVLSGAAAELRAEAADVLRAAHLLVPDGYEAVSASLADHEDVPVPLVWSDRLAALAYFDPDPNAGLVAVRAERLIRHRLDVPAALAAMAPRLDLPPNRPPMPLAGGLAWELGEARLGRRPRVPVWFARRLWEPDGRQHVAEAVLARPFPRQGVVLTSTPRDRLGAVVFPGAVVVPVADVLRSADGLAVDADILDARLRGVPTQPDGGPISLSPDGTHLVIHGGDPLVFRSESHIAAVRKLVAAYRAGRRLRAAEVTGGTSLNQFFGAKQWKRLSPHLKTEGGRWGFEP